MRIFHRNYFILLILGLMFAAPGITAYFFYLHPSWLGEKTTNKGRFIQPPELLLNTGKNAKWQIVLWNPGSCDKNCLRVIDKLARTRLALGRYLYDIDFNVMLSENASQMSKPLFDRLIEQDIHVLRLSREEQQRVSVLNQHREIFIVNPNHFLILAYQDSVKPNDLFHDIKQLLTK